MTSRHVVHLRFNVQMRMLFGRSRLPLNRLDIEVVEGSEGNAIKRLRLANSA